MESGICFWVWFFKKINSSFSFENLIWFWSGSRISPMVNCWLTSYESPGSSLLQRSWFQVQFFKTKKNWFSLSRTGSKNQTQFWFDLSHLNWNQQFSLAWTGYLPHTVSNFPTDRSKVIHPRDQTFPHDQVQVIQSSRHECGGWDLRAKQKRRERERERRWGSTCSSSSSSNLYFPGSSNNCLQFGTFALLHSSPCQILFLLLAFWWDLGGPEGKERWEAGLR